MAIISSLFTTKQRRLQSVPWDNNSSITSSPSSSADKPSFSPCARRTDTHNHIFAAHGRGVSSVVNGDVAGSTRSRGPAGLTSAVVAVRRRDDSSLTSALTGSGQLSSPDHVRRKLWIDAGRQPVADPDGAGGKRPCSPNS